MILQAQGITNVIAYSIPSKQARETSITFICLTSKIYPPRSPYGPEVLGLFRLRTSKPLTASMCPCPIHEAVSNIGLRAVGPVLGHGNSTAPSGTFVH